MSLRSCGGRYDVSGGNRSKPEIIYERNLCKHNYIIMRHFNKISHSQIRITKCIFYRVISKSLESLDLIKGQGFTLRFLQSVDDWVRERNKPLLDPTLLDSTLELTISNILLQIESFMPT